MKNISDQKLYELCQAYGRRVLEARRKFVGLLPEVYRRRLYEKKGFSSIYEFSAKLAGLSKEQVDRVLNLEKKFKDKPILKQALIKGEISVNKLARVASIATTENQEFLKNQAQKLSQKSLETLVRDFKPKNEVKFVRAHKLELDEDVEKELSELQEKGIDINNLLREFLQKRKLEIAREKEQLSQEKAKSRHIPAKVKKIIKKEHGTKCAIPGCHKLSTTLHHTARFALSKSHDPHFIAPLCREHHQIAHKIDQKYLQKSSCDPP